MEEGSLLKITRQNCIDHHNKKVLKTNQAYSALKENLIQWIKSSSKDGKSCMTFKPKRHGITIWDAVPRLLKDDTFTGFVITPENPDVDDEEIRIKWC